MKAKVQRVVFRGDCFWFLVFGFWFLVFGFWFLRIPLNAFFNATALKKGFLILEQNLSAAAESV
jgi:hypothetical protein